MGLYQALMDDIATCAPRCGSDVTNDDRTLAKADADNKSTAGVRVDMDALSASIDAQSLISSIKYVTLDVFPDENAVFRCTNTFVVRLLCLRLWVREWSNGGREN